jgi:uncharacterized phage-like protein YoqJ
MKIAVTGHRPNKLWGYKLEQPAYRELYRRLQQVVLEHNGTHLISGMALGVDTVFALLALNMPGVTLECAIPCSNQTARWLNKTDVERYNAILSRADVVTYVSREPYTAGCMQARNEYMVNTCDLLIAVWDGSRGGTANCVNYAKTVSKPIVVINPREIDGV